MLDTLGYSDDERVNGAPRLVDDLTAHGSAKSIAVAVQRHLDAGADHVILQPVAASFAAGVDQLEATAPVITAITR